MITPVVEAGYVKACGIASKPYAYAKFEVCSGMTLRVVLSHEELEEMARKSKGSLWKEEYSRMAMAAARLELARKYAGAIKAWIEVHNGVYDHKLSKEYYFIEVKS